MRVLGIVPARGGSKGVPGKNTKLLAGKPLIQWSVEAAVASKVIDRLILSTEDEHTADLGREMSVEVPFLRPAALADDTAKMVDVVLHTLDALGTDGYVPDAVAVLQPTSPLRRPEHLRAAVELLSTSDADAVCGVSEVPRELCPHYVMAIEEDGYLRHFLPDGAQYTRRQDVPPSYRRDGTVYLTRTSVVVEHGDLYGRRCRPLLIEPADSLSIDDEEDWDLAERRLLHRLADAQRQRQLR